MGPSLYHEFHGKGKRHSCPLVFIPGHQASKLSWRDFWKPLAEHFKILLLDNRGIGQSPKVIEDYSTLEMAQDVMALLDQYGIQKASFFGHSMGGAIVQEIGRHFPKRIEKLIIASSFAKFPTNSQALLKAFDKLKPYQIPRENMIDLTLPWLFGETFLESQNLKNEILVRLKNPYVPDTKSSEQQTKALLSFNSRAWINEISSPTLILHGDEDLYVPFRFSEELHKGIINSKLVKVQGAGHGIHVEKKEIVLNELLNFLIS